MPPELLAQFPIAEAAVDALGIVLWPMVEFEADDAIAAAATRFAEDPAVEKILVCTPDKDMAQLVRDERVVLWDRRRGLVYDDAGVREKWGVAADLDPGLARPRRRLVGRLSGAPRLGREVGGGRADAGTATTRTIPAKASAWEVPGIGGSRAMTLAATLRDHWDEALLYRDLARLRTADDGVPIRQTRPRRAALGRRPARRVGGVLRGMGAAATGGPAAPLARGRLGRRRPSRRRQFVDDASSRRL